MLKLYGIVRGREIVCAFFVLGCSSWLYPTLSYLYLFPLLKVTLPVPSSRQLHRDCPYFISLGRSPGEGNGNPPQYSCLENPMDGEAWWATVHGVAKSRTRLSDFTFIDFHFVSLTIDSSTEPQESLLLPCT